MSRLYIKGCLPSTVLAEAELEPGDEVWTINKQPSAIEKPPTRHFSLHGLEHELQAHGETYFLWLSKQACPVYLWPEQIPLWQSVVKDESIPLPLDTRPFPLDAIDKALNPPRSYFTGSFAYLMAYALCMGEFDEVDVLGVEFSDKDLWQSRQVAAEIVDYTVVRDETKDAEQPDYSARYRLEVCKDLLGTGSGDESWARECIMYWAGRLEGMGIRVITHASSELFSNKWLRTHCKETGSPYCGLYGLCECIGG